MKLNFNYLNKTPKTSGPWRDWNWLLLGFCILIILVIVGNIVFSWYIKTTISYSLQSGQATVTTLNQKALAKTLETIAGRDLEYQAILNNPKTFTDPSL